MTELRCKGTILDAAKLRPTSARFPRLEREPVPHTTTIDVQKGDGGPIKPEILPITDEHIEAKLTEISPGDHYKLEVTVTPPFERDHLRSNIRLATGLDAAQQVTIPVFASQNPRVTSSPRVVLVPPERDGDWTTRIQLLWHAEGSFKVTKAQVNDKNIRVQPDAEHPNEVIVVVSPDFSLRAGSRFVTVSTNDEQTPHVRVPLRMSARSRVARQPNRSAPRVDMGTKDDSRQKGTRQ